MSSESATNFPAHLSEQQLAVTLSDSFGEPVQIRQLDIKKQQSCGHYCSDIHHLTVKYVKGAQEEQQQPNAKLHVAHILVKDLFENVSNVSNEHFMYTRVLPEMNATLSDCGIAPVSPYVYHARKTQSETHYFENLSVRGYKIFPRLIGYDEQAAFLLLQRLGQFHAASLLYTEKHPEVVTKLREYYGRADPGLMAMCVSMIDANIAHITKIMETWPGFEAIVPKLRANTGAAFRTKFLAMFDVEDASIKLVTHGDLWISNILMLSDDAGAVKDAVFLDYQASFYGSPAFDIHNLLLTSVQLPVLQQRYDDLIEHYHTAFSDTLRAAHYDTVRIPSLELLRVELRRTGYYNYFLLMFPFAQTMLGEELTKGMNIHAFSDEARLALNREDIYSNARVLDTYKYMVKQFETRHMLDSCWKSLLESDTKCNVQT